MAKSSFLTYLRHAFGFRPFGMLFPPHLAGLAAFALLGLLNPGFVLIGLALEGAYLLAMVSHPRFRALVDRAHAPPGTEAEVEAALARLGERDRARFEALRERCEALAGEAEHEAEALSGLLQVHLGLLGAQTSLQALAATADRTLERHLDEVDARLREPDLDAELRRSLEGRRDVLAQRAATQREAERKLEYVQAELTRIEDQVALLQEQAALAANPTVAAADRVDAIAGAIAETRRWLDGEATVEGTDRVPLPAIRARRAVSSRAG